MSQAGVVRVVALVGVLLTLGAALCVFDNHGTGYLCLISLALLSSACAFSPLPFAVLLELKPARTYLSLLTDCPSPPPKS